MVVGVKIIEWLHILTIAWKKNQQNPPGRAIFLHKHPNIFRCIFIPSDHFFMNIVIDSIKFRFRIKAKKIQIFHQQRLHDFWLIFSGTFVRGLRLCRTNLGTWREPSEKKNKANVFAELFAGISQSHCSAYTRWKKNLQALHNENKQVYNLIIYLKFQ